MTPRNRSGLTLIEVVVIVVVVLFLLVMLLIPYINHAHSEARQAQCMGRQAQLTRHC